MKFLCHPCGIKHYAMMFLIRLETVSIRIEAKSFTHKPIHIFCINSILFAIWFVTKATELFTIRHKSLKPKLRFLCRVNIKTSQLNVTYTKVLPTFQAMKLNNTAYPVSFFRWKSFTANRTQKSDNFTMAPNMQMMLEL